nr:GNAT family N-acetyltransferase [uncultured Pseudomonas sp.]
MRPFSTLETPHQRDYPTLTSVWEESVRATHTFLPEPYIVLLRDKVLRHYLDAVMLVCARAPDRTLQGFVGVASGRIDLLFVAPQWHAQGIGKRLLHHAVQSLGAQTLDVNEQNTQALGFYLHEGFEIVGRSPKDGLGQPYPLLHMRLRGTA